MKFINKKIYNLQIDYIKSHFEVIDVKVGESFFNRQCHRNSVEYAKKNKLNKIALVFLIDDTDVILHCVNYSKGKFVDNTLGHEIKDYDCYFIKFSKLQLVLDDFHSMINFMKRILPFYFRKFEDARV